MQLDFKFEQSINYYLDDFIVFKGNREAFNFVNGKLDNDINNRIFLISGGDKTGKTYLARIWQKLSGAIFLDFNKMNKIKDLKEYHIALMNFIQPDKNYILEDLDELRLAEDKLFHLINIINEKRAKLLITSKKLVSDFFFETNDLQSRFQNIINIKIGVLDKDSKRLFIMKLLADKQLKVDEKVVHFLVKNSSLVHKDIYELVENIMKAFLQEKKRKITVGFLKNLLP